MHDMALLSQLAYDAPVMGTSSPSFQAALEAKLGGRFAVDPSIANGQDAVAFVEKSTDGGPDKVVVAFRGTDVRDASDLWTDIAIFFGVQGLTSRFAAARDTVARAVAKYGAGNVTTTGHSLGGTQALYTAARFSGSGVVAHAFNPGYGVPLTQQKLLNSLVGKYANSTSSSSNLNAYSTGLDPISFFQPGLGVNVHYSLPKYRNVHGLQNFL